jgi:hypothetical protein
MDHVIIELSGAADGGETQKLAARVLIHALTPHM